MFVGHSHLVQNFQELVRRGRLAHGYIFFGEPQVGKFYFAKHLANFLENGEFKVDNRPLQDLMIIDPSTSVDLETDAIGIESVRLIRNFLWKKPAISSKRMLIIDCADHLTTQAQAAILKITEEPPASGLLILIVNQLENLAPTLLSRFQKIYFGRLSDAEMRDFLKGNKKSAPDRIIALAGGRPGRAHSFLSGSLKEAEKYAAAFLKAAGSKHSALIKQLVEAQKEKPELLDDFFEAFILQLRQDPIKNNRVLKSALHRLFLIKQYNTNKRIQLEAVM